MQLSPLCVFLDCVLTGSQTFLGWMTLKHLMLVNYFSRLTLYLDFSGESSLDYTGVMAVGKKPHLDKETLSLLDVKDT